MSSGSFSHGAVNQPCELLCGAIFPPSASSFNSLSGGLANTIETAVDFQQLTPAKGRLGVEEIPFADRDPIPGLAVPPPPGGWAPQTAREDDLRRFMNRSTQGLDGGARSTDITRFHPQLVQYQQPDDMSRHRMFERMSSSHTKDEYPVYP